MSLNLKYENNFENFTLKFLLILLLLLVVLYNFVILLNKIFLQTAEKLIKNYPSVPFYFSLSNTESSSKLKRIEIGMKIINFGS